MSDSERRLRAIQAILDALAHLVPSGGDGDLDTATVTFVDEDVVGAPVKGAFCVDETTEGSISVADWFTDSGAIKIALYHGKALIDASGIFDEGATFTLSGNAVEKPEIIPNGILVTGDCTITVTAG